MVGKMVVVKLLMVLLLLSGPFSYAQNSDSVTTVQLSDYERLNPEKASSDYYLRGKEILIKGDVELAVKYFVKVLTIDPNHAPSNYELAKVTSPKVGLECSLKAFQSDSTNYWYCAQLADLYSSLQMSGQAVEFGQRMVKLSPMNDEAYKKLATFYYYNNQLDEAMSLVDTMFTRFGKDPEIALLHCNMIKNLRKPTPKMVQDVQDYIIEFSDLPHFVMALGDIYFAMGLDKEAVACLKRAREIDPQEFRGDVALFDYYFRGQNQGEAVKYLPSLFKAPEIDLDAKIKIYKDLIETNVYLYRNFFQEVDDASMSLMLAYPTNMKVRKLYTEHLLRKGEIGSALAFNKTGLESGIYDYDSFETIVQIEAYNKSFDSLEVLINKGIELFPERVRDLNFSKISLYSMTNRGNEAIVLVNKEIKTIKDDSLLSVYYSVLGDIYHSMDKNKQAYKAYDSAIRYDSENIAALNNYSYYLSLEGKSLDKALKMSMKVVAKEPSNSTYIDTYAWILYKLGRYEEARGVIAKAVALDTTKNSSLMLHYGDILYKLDQKSLAETYWRKALEYGESGDVIEQRLNQK